ncbi:hypothetical protein ACWEQU_03300 [Streptomyces nodosus]
MRALSVAEEQTEAGSKKPFWNILAVFAVSALFHVGVVLFVHLSSNGQPLYPDARRYEQQSMLMTFAWRYEYAHSPDQIAGSSFWGYSAAMALCRLLTGGGWLAAKTALSLFASTGALAAHGLATLSGCGRRRATAVGLIVGTSPSLLLWDAWGLKDGLITTLLLWCLFLLLRARFTLACLTALAGIQLCSYLRAAAAIFLATALLTRLRFRRGYLTGLVVTGVAALAFVIPRATTLIGLVSGLEIGAGNYIDFSGGYGSRNLLSNPQYIAHFLFGPFPWAFGPETATPGRWLYLGTTVWIASLVLIPVAVKKAWKDTEGAGRTMVLASAAYTATYLLSFGAEFYRQRSVTECMMMILIVLYVPLSPAAAAARVLMWLSVVAGLAVLQASYLTPTVWSKWLAGGVLCCMLLTALVRTPFTRLRR